MSGRANDPASFVNNKSISTCPTAAAQPPEFDLTTRVVFNYGMNYKGITGLTGVAYGTNFSATAIVYPSAIVFLSDVRGHSTETPFFGNNPKEVGCSHCWIAQLASRHNAGENINCGDGHVGYFRYNCVCQNGGTKAVVSDVNWTYNGQRVP